MLWTPQKGLVKTISNGQIIGTTPGTAIVASGTTLLNGTVTELVSAANNVQDSWGIIITIIADAASGALATETCLDILIGGATDDVLIPALICGGAIRAPTINYFFPLHIPQGKRIAGILASVKVSMAYHVLVTLLGGSPPPFRVGRKVTAYGTQINNARGVAITPAASGGAASVTQIVAATSEDHFAIYPGFQCSTDTTMTTGQMNIGIGLGAAAEDRVGTWFYSFSSAEEAFGPFPAMPVFHDIPAGSRLTMLASNSGLNDAAYDGLIYAVS